jgi:hypothetical protein
LPAIFALPLLLIVKLLPYRPLAVTFPEIFALPFAITSRLIFAYCALILPLVVTKLPFVAYNIVSKNVAINICITVSCGNISIRSN